MVKVAVVIPVYNVKDYLNECIDSVINQTLKDILIILVNDGSVDNCLEIINEYAKMDNRVIVIDKVNSGYGDSMNVGIQRAIKEGAEYIAFMDSDDYIADDGYEKLYKIAKCNNVDVLRANITSVLTDDKGDVSYFKNDSLKLFPEFYNKIVSLKDNKQLFMMNSNCGGLFKTSFISENGIKHNITPGAAYQDIGFWFQCYALAERFYFCSDRYYFYRRERPGSSVEGKKDNEIIFKEYAFIYDFLNKNPLLKKEFLSQYYIAKYRSLYWYFHLLSEENKRPFIYRVSKEFNVAINNNEFSLREAKEVSDYLHMIITNPEQFLELKEKESKVEKKSPLVVPK